MFYSYFCLLFRPFLYQIVRFVEPVCFLSTGCAILPLSNNKSISTAIGIIIPIIEKNRLDICESVNTSLFASIFTFSVMSAPKYTP